MKLKSIKNGWSDAKDKVLLWKIRRMLKKANKKELEMLQKVSRLCQ